MSSAPSDQVESTASSVRCCMKPLQGVGARFLPRVPAALQASCGCSACTHPQEARVCGVVFLAFFRCLSRASETVRLAWTHYGHKEWPGTVPATDGAPCECAPPASSSAWAASAVQGRRATVVQTISVDSGVAGNETCEGSERRSHPAPHVLFASSDAGRARKGDSRTGRASRVVNDAALHAPESGSARLSNSIARLASPRHSNWRHSGDGVAIYM